MTTASPDTRRTPDLLFTSEPRRGVRFHALGTWWNIDAVAHHGGSRAYSLDCSAPFVQGGMQRTFHAKNVEAV